MALTQYKFITLQFYSSDSVTVSLEQNQGVSRGGFLFRASRENLFPCPFQLLEATHSLWLLPSSSIFKAKAAIKSSSCCHLSYIPLLPSSSIYKDPWGYTGLTQIIQDNLPYQGPLISNLNSTCNLKSLLPCNLIWILGIRMWSYLGAIILPTTASQASVVPRVSSPETLGFILFIN